MNKYPFLIMYVLFVGAIILMSNANAAKAEIRLGTVWGNLLENV